MDIAQNSSNLLLSLVSDTLDYFKIKQGKFDLKREATHINELAQQTFDLISF